MNLTPYRFTGNLDQEPGNPTYLGNFAYKPAGQPALSDDYLSHDLLLGSDYLGDSVTVANVKAFLRDYGTIDGVLSLYGDYGTYGVLLRRDVLPQVQDVLDRLEEYPLLDEDLHTEVEMEAEDEAWDSWAAGDYRRALAELHPDQEDALDAMEPEALRDLFYTASDQAGIYWKNETGNGAWIDVDRVAEATVIQAICLVEGSLKGA